MRRQRRHAGDMLRQLFEVLILPPASALALLLAGSALRRWRPRLGRGLQVGAIAWIWLASTPCVGGMMLCSLQSTPALPKPKIAGRASLGSRDDAARDDVRGDGRRQRARTAGLASTVRIRGVEDCGWRRPGRASALNVFIGVARARVEQTRRIICYNYV